ncbi:MAG: DUF502 domain-containing protein [Nitrospirota bacterium]
MESIKATFKKKFISGLIVSIPAIITIMVIVWLYRFVDGLLSPALDRLLERHVPGLGFITTLLAIFLLGLISTNVIGRRMLHIGEKIFLHIPFFKSLYTTLKQIFDAFSPDNRSGFQRFVIVEYPRPGIYTFGFLTKECVFKGSDEGCERGFSAVYVPTNNLYLGNTVLFKKDEVLYTDFSIEEGIRIILSGGIATPEMIGISVKNNRTQK